MFVHAEPQAPEVDIGFPHIEIPGDVSTVSESQIHQRAASSDIDVLRALPGLTVSQSGGAGQPSAVFIRGADSAGTLVLLDGFPLNDPSLGNGGFDFSNLNLSDVERVEVWKGPQSVLFGSGATGGVINIVSRRGSGPLRLHAETTAGSQNTWRGRVGLSGAHGTIDYALSLGRVSGAGISAAAPSDGGVEPDGYTASTGSARLGWQPEAHLDLIGTLRWGERFAALDFAPSPIGPNFIENDAPNFYSKARNLSVGLEARERWGPAIESSLAVTQANQARSYENTPRSSNPGFVQGSYSGISQRIENRNLWRLGDGSTLLFEPVFERASTKSDYATDSYRTFLPSKASSLFGFMGRLQKDSERYFVTAGARLDHHELFGRQQSFEFSPGLHLSSQLDLFVRGSTAYKAPTLFELHDPLSGNKDLRPETVRSVELSLSRYLGQHKNKLQISGFVNQYRDLIQFQSMRHVNLGSAVVRGVETQAIYGVSWFSIAGGYTYLETRDDSTGHALLRRPQGSATASISVEPQSSSISGSVEYGSVGRRADVDPVTGQSLAAAGFQVMSLRLNWKVSENLRTHFSVLNVTDTKYEEVAGYSSPPISYYLTAEVQL